MISLDFYRNADTIVGTIDLARGDGYVLAEQPVLELLENDETIPANALATAERAIGEFLTLRREVTEAELERAGGTG